MSGTEPTVEADEPGTERMEKFEAEVSRLRLGGGRVSVERLLGKLSGLGIAVGLLLVFLSWRGTRSSIDPLDLADNEALGTLGLAITIAGTGIYIVASLRRYLRYWLLRLVYEHRAQTDRIVETER